MLFELLGAASFLPQSNGSLRLPIQHIFTEQLIAHGLAQPSERQFGLSRVEIVISERERRSGSRLIFRISRGKAESAHTWLHLAGRAAREKVAPAVSQGDPHPKALWPRRAFWSGLRGRLCGVLLRCFCGSLRARRGTAMRDTATASNSQDAEVGSLPGKRFRTIGARRERGKGTRQALADLPPQDFHHPVIKVVHWMGLDGFGTGDRILCEPSQCHHAI